KYEMHIQEGQKIIYHKNISDTLYQAINLRPGTFYVVKVRAYSLGGNGPWSHEFQGCTLDDTALAPKLIWAVDKEILLTNLAGSESSVLISQDTLQTKLKEGKIADLAFFRDSLVMAVNNQSVFVMNLTTSKFTEMPNTHGVLSVSVDWLTQRLFWANPHRQMIGWTNLNGSSQGPLNVVTAAREVRVDALHGRLFWTTPHALLMSTLAGRNVTTIHQEGIFSGKQVYGLTVDSQGSRIWWIVRDAEGCRLFGASIGNTLNKFPSKLLPHTVKVGPMWYLSERLLWLGEDGDVVVSDTNLNNSAAIHTSNLGVSHFIVVLPDLQPVPDGVERPVVTPGLIDANSLLVKGTWTNFSLEWNPITNVNYGSLMYEVIIDNGNSKKAFLTNETIIPYKDVLPPYSSLKVSVRGITDWSAGTRLLKNLHTPAHLPEAPQDLRTFVHKVQDSVAKIYLRWSPPEKPNGEIINYKILYCTAEVEEKCKSEIVNGKVIQLTVENLSSDHLYMFKVAAINEMGKGPYSSGVTESLQQHKPTPSLLVVSDKSLIKLDADLQEEVEVLSENSRVQWATPLLKNSSFAWMDMNSDIYLTDMKTNFTERLLRLNDQGVGLAVDWIGEVILWAERESVASNEIKIKTFNIDQKTETLVTLLNITGNIKKFLLSPMTSQVFLLHDGHKDLQLLSMRLSVNTLQNVFSEERSSDCNCMTTPRLGGGIALDTSNTSDLSLYFVASQPLLEPLRTTTVYKTDLSGCFCEAIFVPEDYGYGACTEIAVDYAYLYCFMASNQTLLWLPKRGIEKPEDLHSQPLHNTTSLIPVDLAIQPMPDAECLVTSNYTEAPTNAGTTETVIAIQLTAPEAKTDNCRLIIPPPVTYIGYYAPVTHNESVSCFTDITHCQYMKSMRNVIRVTGLQPYTQYVFRGAVETIYNKRMGIKSVAGPAAIFKTKAKAPEGVDKVTAEALSPEEIKVTFNVSEGQMCEVYWQRADTNLGPIHPTVNSTQEISVRINRLLPNTKYEVWVRVYSQDRLVHTNSPRVTVITLPELPHIRLKNATARTLFINWKAPSDRSVLRHAFQYTAFGDSIWENLTMEQTTAGQTYFANITHLAPATSYIFRVQVIYNNTYYSYTWPEQPLFNFSTLAEIPGEPGQVMRQQVGGVLPGGGLRLWWSEAKPNGAPVIAYTLQASLYNSNDFDNNITYATIYNGSDNYWLIKGLEAESSYIFRVRAINELGAGPWGEVNVIDTVVGPTMLTQTDLPTILASTIPTSLIFFGVFFTSLIYGMKRAERRRRKVKAASLNDSHHHHHHHPRSREVELATLRQLPINNNFVTENNVLYNLHTFPGDDLDLPHVSRHCINLTKFLGCGAFGEVFEGTACGLPCLPEVTKVAIKTLRKGATETEKAEFLKEAQLMSHFQHEHILRLLAVCTDHDPFFLILELMEGGDLLSYLRTSRGVECSLTLADLVAMCLDVAKGCVYLEEMHYVHRDLAARNCLVSTTDPESRIVKIGDFGLARDIYKNDYYRKEGEGLLPVRWLSPESLVDGVFTSHSDVWAFGVLLWEILTLGQQPYPARTNLEVLHYVRGGGRLNRPPNCPEELHKLMERCWSYSPENRPTFKECLRALLMLEETISALPALAVHNVHYIGSNGNSLVSGNDCSPSNSWSAQTSGSVINLGGRNGSQDDAGNGVEVEECDSFSGASTLPLTAPLRRHQQYLQLVSEPSLSSPPVSPRSPPASLPLGAEASFDLPRFSAQTSTDFPRSPTSLITTAQVSIPSTPLSPSIASPIPDSPTSVTFTFPLTTMSSVMSPQHYLKPSNNKVYTGPCLQAGPYDNEGQDIDLDSNYNPLLDNSYVNMSAGDLKQRSDLTNTKDFGKINGVNLRHKRDCDIIAELDNHRLSGVSALSAVSGMTSASTVDLDHSPSQSWC
ncbi:hypothetical protein OTU49_016899, partial [Cherax quadricarinatus]